MLDFTGYILSPPSRMVTIREEVLHTQSYIDILQARHAGEFKVVWEIDDAALQALTCRVILQPLVENAYYHGIRKSAKEGVKNIWIKIHDTGDEILIRVIDNGSGMEQELVAKIQEQLADPNVLEKHIGIYNPHKRIRLHFGGQSGIYIHSHLGVGTCIIVRFPHVKQEEKEN